MTARVETTISTARPARRDDTGEAYGSPSGIARGSAGRQLRVSEAVGADVGALGVERGHRTLTVLRKSGKTVTIPLAPRTARAVDLPVGERYTGPTFAGANGGRLDLHGAARVVGRVDRRAGIIKRIGPHALRAAGQLPVVKEHGRSLRRWPQEVMPLTPWTPGPVA